MMIALGAVGIAVLGAMAAIVLVVTADDSGRSPVIGRVPTSSAVPQTIVTVTAVRRAPTAQATTSTGGLPASTLVGSWHGVVTQYAPRGTVQRVAISSEIRSAAGGLTGKESETTVAGNGTGEHCAGRLYERARSGHAISFDFQESTGAHFCIAHTVVSFRVERPDLIAFSEPYETGIGPGRLVGHLER